MIWLCDLVWSWYKNQMYTNFLTDPINPALTSGFECIQLVSMPLSCFFVSYILFLCCCAAGMIDCPGTQDGSSLRSLIDKPPVCGNSFSPLTGALLTGFRLHTGPVLLGTPPTHTHSKITPISFYNKYTKILLSRDIYCLCIFSSQNSIDWCTYSLQRRRVNTSTNTIDRRTHYHKVQT